MRSKPEKQTMNQIRNSSRNITMNEWRSVVTIDKFCEFYGALIGRKNQDEMQTFPEDQLIKLPESS